MAELTAPQSNLISRVAAEVKQLAARDGLYVQSDVLWTKYTNPDTPDLQVTQEKIDSVASFKNAGVKLEQVTAMVYALKMVHVAMNADLDAFVVMANL